MTVKTIKYRLDGVDIFGLEYVFDEGHALNTYTEEEVRHDEWQKVGKKVVDYSLALVDGFTLITLQESWACQEISRAYYKDVLKRLKKAQRRIDRSKKRN